jgi:AraC-like DNA-binding protein
MKPTSRAYDGANIEWELRSVRSPRVTFGQVRYQPGGYCGPRVQRDYQLVLLYSGSCDLHVGSSSRSLKVGNVYLLKPGHREHFLFDAARHTHHFWCSAAPAHVGAALRQSLDAAPPEGQPPSECFTRLVSAAFLLRPGRSPAAEQVVDTLSQALFCEFLNMAAHARQMSRDDASVVRALRHMEDHLAAPDCLAGARSAAGCSVNALSYKFLAAVGATPARHLWRLRAEKGLELLADTGLSVAEIADRCGFKNPFHFSRCVRRLQSLSPREVRRRAWD